MTKLLERAGSSFLRAFAVTFLFAATGLLSAPDLQTAVALSWAALAASIVAGLRAVQVLVPQISFSAFLPQPSAAWADSFVRAFVGVFLTMWAGWLAAPDMSTWKSAVLAATIGAITAGVRALQGLLTNGESPTPGKGLS
jgi:hypothetical protein